MRDTVKSKDYVDNPSPIHTLDSRLGLFGLDCIYNFEIGLGLALSSNNCIKCKLIFEVREGMEDEIKLWYALFLKETRRNALQSVFITKSKMFSFLLFLYWNLLS